MAALRYSIVTPARDEAQNLRRLAGALSQQTVLPTEWIIVENGSGDRTLEMAKQLAATNEWIKVMWVQGEVEPVRGRPIVRAFEAGVAALAEAVDVVVNVDADISMRPGYFEGLMGEFAADPSLGIASGSGYEERRGAWRERHVTGSTVWGASRAYRWQCLQEILPLEELVGWDGIDELKANVSGWRTQTFPHLPFLHHRAQGERDRTRWSAWAAQGAAAHYMGYRFWYLILRALYHGRHELSALGMVEGYAAAWLRREPQLADANARAYLRSQQSLRMLPRRMREVFGARGIFH